MPLDTISALNAKLDRADATAAGLTEAALARASDPALEGGRTYIALYREAAPIAAAGQDLLRKAGASPSPLAGIPVSIKDLFDVAGETTLAASRALADAPAATRDAPVIMRLKRAGAVLIGRTNMSEFAFSGLGINPHFGTPGNPADRQRIPGGSSSGAAVSVADGSAAVGIGSDTGGSVRIPAALCGLVGFKPTQRRVPRDGVLPLSTSLDSIGPIAPSVACCALVDAILAGIEPDPLPEVPLEGLRFVVPVSYVWEGCEDAVLDAFVRARRRLEKAGAQIRDVRLPALDRLPTINASGGFAAAEAYEWHAALIERRGDLYDPLVRSRILRGGAMSAADYIGLRRERLALIAEIGGELAGYDALLMPTVPVVAPRIAALSNPDTMARVNQLTLRNPMIVNFLDCCAVSLPMQEPGALPSGLTLMGENCEDRRLLAIARSVEAAIAY